MKSIQECLANFPLDELMDLGFRFFIHFPTEGTRAAWSQVLAKTMENPDQLFDYLTMEEWQALLAYMDTAGKDEQGIVKIPVRVAKQEPMLWSALMELKQAGLVWQNRSAIMHIQPAAIRAAEKVRNEMDTLDHLEMYHGLLRGYLWLYGMLTVPQLERMLRESKIWESDEETSGEIANLMLSLHIKRGGSESILMKKKEVWMVGDDVEEPEELLKRLNSKEMKQRPYAVYTVVDALNAISGQGNSPWRKSCSRAAAIYMELGMDAEEAADKVEDIVYLYRNGYMEEAMDELMTTPKTPTPEQVRRLIGFIEYVPLWQEKGRTLHDLKPAPLRGPDHVGRNDPCPCGSGRKYKNCCGRLQ